MPCVISPRSTPRWCCRGNSLIVIIGQSIAVCREEIWPIFVHNLISMRRMYSWGVDKLNIFSTSAAVCKCCIHVLYCVALHSFAMCCRVALCCHCATPRLCCPELLLDFLASLWTFSFLRLPFEGLWFAVFRFPFGGFAFVVGGFLFAPSFWRGWFSRFPCGGFGFTIFLFKILFCTYGFPSGILVLRFVWRLCGFPLEVSVLRVPFGCFWF